MFRVFAAVSICLCLIGNLLIPIGSANADVVAGQVSDCQQCVCDDRCCVSDSESPSLPLIPVGLTASELSKSQIVRAAKLVEITNTYDDSDLRTPTSENLQVGYAGVALFLFCLSLLI